MGPADARRLWLLLEPYHAVTYFATEAREAHAAAGCRGFWMGYFGTRAAPLGPVKPDVVAALFFNFHPAMVARAIPDAWRFSSPAGLLEARLAGVDAALRRRLGEGIGSAEIRDAATLSLAAARACDPAGRPMGAANLALGPPDEPHLALWHAATVLREHRGDGHVASLVAEGIDGCEAHVMLVAAGGSTEELQKTSRGWSDDDWGAARERLRARGVVDAAGALTGRGAALRRSIEDRTDRLALRPYELLGTEACRRLAAALAPLSAAAGAEIPYPNPMGLPPPGK